MRLRLVNALLYAVFALVAASALARPAHDAFAALVRPYSYEPDLQLPALWLLLVVALAVLVADVARRLLAGGKAGMSRYVALLFVCALSLGARRALEPPTRPTPADALDHLVARVEAAADAAFAQDKRYPAAPAPLEEGLPEHLRALGYWARGARELTSRVRVLDGRTEPVLRAPEGVHPGDVVFARDSSGRRYWITAFVLDRRGRLAPMPDARGQALVAAGADGRAASRLDPLFPDYPHPAPIGPHGNAGASLPGLPGGGGPQEH